MSDKGRVRSQDRLIRKRSGKGKERGVFRRGVVLSQLTKEGGYRTVQLAGRSRSVHSLVLEAFVGPRPRGQEVRHGNGDPGDNRLGNLSWGTRADNADDKRRHGTHEKLQVERCRKGGHLLAGANLERWTNERTGRKCYACHRGLTAATNARKRGLHLDAAMIADAYYAWLMEGGPDPRHDRALRKRAEVAAPTVARLPDGRGASASNSAMRVLRLGYAAGDETSPSEARERMRLAGVEVTHNAACMALARSVERGYFERVKRGRYRRLEECAA